ncbi:MAG: hypothetical protein ACOX2A_09360, partial [Tepidanaerobacteraceae bacterium]
NLAEARITIDDVNNLTVIFGNQDKNIKCIEDEFKVKIMTRDGDIAILGDINDVNSVKQLFNQLYKCCGRKSFDNKRS